MSRTSHPPITRATYVTGSRVSVDPAAYVQLPWTQGSGDALLDLTDPSNPTIVAAGVYALSAVFTGIDLTAGASFYSELDLDSSGEDAEAYAVSPAAAGAATTMALACVYYIPTGGVVQASVENHDSVARSFQHYAVLQRIT